MADIPAPTRPELTQLSEVVESPEKLASGSKEIQNAALGAAKFVFDLSLKSEESSLKHINDLLTSITPSLAPQTRSQALNAARQALPPPPTTLFKPTPLTSLFTENLDEEQIWAQLDIRTKNVCEVLEVVLEGELPEDLEEGGEEDEFKKAMQEEGLSFDEEDEDDSEGAFDDDSEEDSEDDEEEDEEDDDEEEEFEGFGEGEDEEEVMDLDDGSSEEEGSNDESVEEELPSRLRKRKKGPKSELDDGFFDLSSFKAEIEKAEARSSSRGHLAEEDESDEEFDDIDLFAPVEGDGVEEEDDSKELFYADFFEAPRPEAAARKKSKSTSKSSAKKAAEEGSRGVRFHEEVRVKKIKRSGKGRSLNDSDSEEEDDEEEDAFGEKTLDEKDSDSGVSDSDEQDEEDKDGSEMDSDGFDSEDGSVSHGRETIERLKDDLLGDDDEEDEQKDMTTHEKRMAALKEQIAQLEQENVSKKHWTLMGEADTRVRPENSLLEEDLEFERTMKPTPVITEEAVHSLEELIKTRIRDNNFDDVVRLRPVDDKPFLPSRLLELKDTKSQQSLAQIYEGEYMAAQAGGSLPDDRDGKLAKEHEEIEAQWDKICNKLDALSNAHFVPKLPKSLISTVSNVSTATMESALPTTKSAASMLAPEEVFSAATSQPRARTELTPAEKKALRAKERKAKRKQRDLLDKTVDKVAKMRSGSVKTQKQAALESIVKHGKGVTVVGKAAKDLKARGKMPKKS